MPPLAIMIKPVSGLCNMRCRYCFYADEMKHRDTPVFMRMNEETLEVLVRRALRYAEGAVTFAFQGGEPTLAGVTFFEKLVAFERKYNTTGLHIENALQTNGYELSDELIDLFAREHFLLGVSVDGCEAAHDAMRLDAAGHGTYARVMHNIGRLRAAGVQFNLLCVVNDLVAQHPQETFRTLEGAGYIQFIACLDELSGDKRDYSLDGAHYLDFLKATFDLYYARFRSGRYVSVRNFDNYVGILLGQEPENCGMRGYCGAQYLVEGDGSVYPCDFYVLDEWRLGNIREDSFFRLAKSPVAEAFRARSRQGGAKCLSCKWRYLCRNGCQRERLGAENLNRFCDVYREFFSYALPHMQEMARRIASGDNAARPRPNLC